jgi:hypothetical protein
MDLEDLFGIQRDDFLQLVQSEIDRRALAHHGDRVLKRIVTEFFEKSDIAKTVENRHNFQQKYISNPTLARFMDNTNARQLIPNYGTWNDHTKGDCFEALLNRSPNQFNVVATLITWVDEIPYRQRQQHVNEAFMPEANVEIEQAPGGWGTGWGWLAGGAVVLAAGMAYAAHDDRQRRENERR